MHTNINGHKLAEEPSMFFFNTYYLVSGCKYSYLCIRWKEASLFSTTIVHGNRFGNENLQNIQNYF